MDLSQLSPEQRKEVEEKLKNMSPEEIAQLQAQQCIFCQLIAGKIPSKKVYEDDVCFAVLDINPAAKGHVLLMPKAHLSIMPQVPDEVSTHMLQVARELSRSLLKNLRAAGTTIFIANGLAAGQRAQHFMIHIIPRKDGDGLFGYEKHIVDEEKRRALRDLVAARMEQLTDFTDVYAHEQGGSGGSVAEVSPETEKVGEPEAHETSELSESEDAKEHADSDGDAENSEDEDTENPEGNEDVEEDDDSEDGEDNEEEGRPGEITDSSLDDIANLFK